ncbi:NUDIX hydrolase [Halobacteriales archaeon SW_6_65_46]|nr:MAG: NUDIX hydrolase [Halobacteriales archaeon SW_6_65_46]
MDDTDADALAWETTDSRIDYDCPGFAVREDSVTFPDGSTGEFHSVTEPDAVVILPFTPDGDVVAIEEWRQAVGRVNLGLPAGGLEADDGNLVAAARRELREETGYETDRLEQVAAVEPANGLLDATHYHFVAHDCRPTAGQSLDENESIRVTERDFDALREAAVAGELRDGRAAVGVLRYAAATESHR